MNFGIFISFKYIFKEQSASYLVTIEMLVLCLQKFCIKKLHSLIFMIYAKIF